MLATMRVVIMVGVLIALALLVIDMFIKAIREVIKCSVEEKLEPIKENYDMQIKARDAYIRRLEWQAAHPQLEVTVWRADTWTSGQD